MSSTEESPMSQPPGTVLINVDGSESVILSPQPSSDPDDPLNWSNRRKVLHVALLLVYTFFIFGSNTASTPLYHDMSRALGYHEFVFDISFAANSAALAVGSLIFVPFALLIGRRSIYIFTSLLMFGCDIWAARSQNTGDVIGSSIVQGLAGSVTEALFQMTVIDLFFVHQRGTINGFYLFCAAAGNFIMPVVSGYLAKATDWRWSLWFVALLMAAISILLILFLEESKYVQTRATEHPLEPQSQTLTDPFTKDGSMIDKQPILLKGLESSQTQGNHTVPRKTYAQRLRLVTLSPKNSSRRFFAQFYRPFVVLFSFPGIFCGAFLYGFYVASINVLAVTQASFYPSAPYHFSSIGVGNLNIAPAIGAAIGAVFGGPLADKAILFFARRNGNIYEPEMRLWLFLLPAIGMSAGILIYGTSVARGRPWYIGSVGGGFMGFGLGGGGDLLISYVQDSYGEIIGPAFTGAVFLVNGVTFVLLFLITPWQAGMGSYDMFVLYGCISIALNFLVVLVIIWGKSWRRRYAKRYRRLAKQVAGTD